MSVRPAFWRTGPLYDGDQVLLNALIGRPGELAITVIDGGRCLRVDRADPKVWLAGPLVREALGTGPDWLHPGAELSSDRLVIDGINQRVVYRIGHYRPEMDCYEAEWPD